jgi:hypothetical protein
MRFGLIEPVFSSKVLPLGAFADMSHAADIKGVTCIDRNRKEDICRPEVHCQGYAPVTLPGGPGALLLSSVGMAGTRRRETDANQNNERLQVI